MSRRGRQSVAFSLFSFQDIITSVTAIVILLTLVLAVEFLSREPSSAARGSVESAATLRDAIEKAEEEIRRLQSRLDGGAEVVQAFAEASPERLRRDCAVTQDQIDGLRGDLEDLRIQEQAAREQEKRVLAQEFDRKNDRRRLAQLTTAARGKRKQLEKLKAENRLIYNPASATDKLAWLVDVSAEQFVVAPLGEAVKPTAFGNRSVAARVLAFSTWARQRSAEREYFVLLVRPSGIESFAVLRSALEKMGFDIGYDVIGAEQTVIDLASGAARS